MVEFSIGAHVKLGGITGQITDHKRDDAGDVWVVNLAGVRCECSTNELRNGYTPHEWEVACGKCDAEIEWNRTDEILMARHPIGGAL